MWQWIAEVVEEQHENVCWQRPGLGSAQAVCERCKGSASRDPRRPGVHGTQFGRRTHHGPGSSVAGGGGGKQGDGRHGHTFQQRHPCEVARAVTFCELVQGLCCKAEQARSMASQPAG